MTAVKVCPINDAACQELPLAMRCDGCKPRPVVSPIIGARSAITSTSRQAFEAHIKSMIESEAGEVQALEKFLDGDYITEWVRYQWYGWQAAIQHARDVATAKCAEISEREHRDFKGLNPDAPPGKRGNSYVEGLSDGADLAGDAIKEALK